MGRKVRNHNKFKSDKTQSRLVTKESISAVCALFSLVVLLILFSRSFIFGAIGLWVHTVLTGAFGYMAYPLFVGLLYLSVTSLIGVRLIKKRRVVVWLSVAVACATLIVHIATTYAWADAGYIARCFDAGETFPACTAGGWFGALIAYPLFSLTTKAGAIVILSVGALFSCYVVFLLIKGKSVKILKTEKGQASDNTTSPVEIPLTQNASQPFATQPYAFPTAEPVQPAQPFSFSAEPVQPAQNGYGYGEVTVNQTPGFSLPDEPVQPQQATQPATGFSPFGVAQNMQEPERVNGYDDAREFLFGGSPAENYRRNLIFDPTAKVNQRPSYDPANQSSYTPSYSDAYQSSVNERVERPAKVFTDYSAHQATETTAQPTQNAYEQPYFTPVQPAEPIVQPAPAVEERSVEPTPFSFDELVVTQREIPEQEEVVEREDTGYRRHEYMDLFSPSNPNLFGGEERESVVEREQPRVEEPYRSAETLDVREERDFGRGRDIFDEEERDAYSIRTDFNENTFEREVPARTFEEQTPTRRFEEERAPVREFDRTVTEETKLDIGEVVAEKTPTPTPVPPKPRVIRPYVRVPLDDFDCRDVEPTSNLQEVEETKANIIATLDDFKVSGASIASVTFGPTVTRYNVTIPRNISPRKVVALDQSIAISLHSAGVNVYPNYEDGVVSIEVPNKDRQFVQLGCMLTGDTYVNAKPSSLMFAMGKDVGNRKVYGDISKMTHLLVAGSSGSGKSVFLGSLIISLIYKYSPEELRLILIDPKKTEFVLYNDLPHLMINEIITDVHKSVQSLNWAIGEMNRRYGLFEQMSRAGTYVVNLDQYNSHLDKVERLPKIVIIIDELADLMLSAKKEIEDRIQNLTQKARAAGIHLIVATQRPSIDVITGVIKSNLATRVAFAVATDVDSRVILDQTGAQKLLGKGDFLYTMQGINTPVRVQSAFISAEDSQRVVNFIKANNEAYYDESATAYINNTRSGGDGDSFGGNEEVEAVYIEALRFVIMSGSASISMIQRKCSVGYNKAGKIVEWMEDMGYISSFDGAKARKVLITKEEFESKYGTL